MALLHWLYQLHYQVSDDVLVSWPEDVLFCVILLGLGLRIVTRVTWQYVHRLH